MCSVRRRAPRHRLRWWSGIEDLERSLPGGGRLGYNVQGLLRHAIGYIEFLQRRIRDTQEALVPHSSYLGFRSLRMPRCEAVMRAPPTQRGRRRGQPRVCVQCAAPEPGLRQQLVPYLSSSSPESADPGPWLPPIAASPCPPISPGTLQPVARPFLGLSPSLQTSPAGDVLIGCLSPPGLFEEVQIRTASPLQELAPPIMTPSLDHCYQSQSGIRIAPIQKQTGAPPPKSQQRKLGSAANHRAPGKAMVSKTPPPTAANSDPPQKPSRKKCVNGFIMFCRLNRRAYLQANPGKASTAATRELAELWRVLSAQERRPYCMKALQFSLMHDRLVKPKNSVIPPGGATSPKPLSELLADKLATPP